ncbi:hypothetical protein LTR66_000861 [Elasticomyces elasticus]|nr:hypothetical protein LTR66_000861 [Elasticomyces elasticus]
MEVDERVLTMFVLLALDRAEDEALWVKLLLNDVVDEDLTTGSRLPDVDDDEAADIELLPDADRASAGTPLIPTELILDADDEATAAETVDNENVDPETGTSLNNEVIELVSLEAWLLDVATGEATPVRLLDTVEDNTIELEMLELSEAAGVIEVELSEPPEGSAMELELEELNEIAGVVEAELPDPVEDSPIKLEPLELIEADEAAEAVPSEEIEEARARTELPNVEEEVTTKAGLLLVVDDEKATNELLKLGDAEEAINVVKLPLDLAREGDETGLLGGVKDEETTEVEMLLNVDSKDMVVDELPELKEAEETTKVELSRDVDEEED